MDSETVKRVAARNAGRYCPASLTGTHAYAMINDGRGWGEHRNPRCLACDTFPLDGHTDFPRQGSVEDATYCRGCDTYGDLFQCGGRK